MNKLLLGFSIIALAIPAYAAPRNTANDAAPQEKKCRDTVGKETTEAEGRAHISHFQAQRFSDCIIGQPM
jgi:hypothetical protein